MLSKLVDVVKGLVVLCALLFLALLPRTKNLTRYESAPHFEGEVQTLAQNTAQFAANNFLSYSRGSGLVHFQTKSFVVNDREVGPIARPNFVRHHILKKDNTTVYDVTAVTDSFSRRVTPAVSTGQEKHLLFFGCSFVFGEGVKQDETLPFYASQAMPGFVAYNYGFGGWGPTNVLARLQRPISHEEVRERMGIAFYVFLDFHVRRAIPSLSTARFTHQFPAFSVNADGQVFRAGFNNTLFPKRFRVFEWLENSWIARRLNLDWPPLKDADFQFTAKLLREIKVEYLKQFPGQKFYVLFYPGTRDTEEMKGHLNSLGVDVFDYSEVQLNLGPHEEKIPFDGHPTAKAHQRLGSLVARDLSL
jgi:hypothetical protein